MGGDYLIQAHGEPVNSLLTRRERNAVIAKAKQVIARIAACDLADRKALLVRMVRLSDPRSSEDGINEPAKSKHVMDGIQGALKLPSGTGEVRCRELDGGITRTPVDPSQGLTVNGDIHCSGIITRANGIRTH